MCATIHYFSKQRGTGISTWTDGRQSYANPFLTVVPYQPIPKKHELNKPSHKLTNDHRIPNDDDVFQPFIPKEYIKPTDQYTYSDNFQTKNRHRDYRIRPNFDENNYYIEQSHQNYLNPTKYNTQYEENTKPSLTYYIDDSKTIKPHVEISPVSPNKTIVETLRPQITAVITTPFRQQHESSFIPKNDDYKNNHKQEEDDYYQHYSSKARPHKYENVPNPFADPNFNFEEFLNKFREEAERDRNQLKHTSSQHISKSESDVNQSFTTTRPPNKPELNNYTPQVLSKVVTSYSDATNIKDKSPHVVNSHRYHTTISPDIISINTKSENDRFTLPPTAHPKPQIQTYNQPQSHSILNAQFKNYSSEPYNHKYETTSRSKLDENTSFRSTVPIVELRTPVPFISSTVKPKIFYDNEEVKEKGKIASHVSANIKSDNKDETVDDDDEYYDDYDDYEYDDDEELPNNHKEAPNILPNQDSQSGLRQRTNKYSAKYQETLPINTPPSPRTSVRPNNINSHKIFTTTTTTPRPIYTIRQRIRSTVRTTTTVTPRTISRQRHKNDETRQDLHYSKDR